MTHSIRFILLALALAPAGLFAQPRFIQVSPDLAMLTCGTPLASSPEETLWQWLPDQGNGGILESLAHQKKGNAPPLRITIDDCTPHSDYEVFGYFWAPGFADDQNKKEVKHWPARFGFGLATLTTYGGRDVARVPWIISLDSQVGRFAGLSATLEESAPLPDLNLTTADGDARLIRARIGVARADANGALMVYLDDFPESAHCEKTRIDGIAIQPAPKDAEPTAGAGDPHVLHLAIRANDWPSAQRELDAGADVNALDDRGRSVLFHPASCGDLETLGKLLTAGADPNRPGQSLLPLTGAASTGSIDAVRMLVDSGAELPSTRIEPSEPRHAWTIGRGSDSVIDDCALLHPAIAAIRTGSLASLKILLEKCPGLNLETLSTEDPEGEQARRTDALSRFLIEDAMCQGHDDLAAFLIDRGCTLSAGKLLWGNQSPDPRPHALLAYAICAEPVLEKSLTALLRRGVSPIRKLGPPHYSRMAKNHGIPPWDGLSAAVAVANVELTQHFLLEAKDLPLYYKEFLLAMAQWHGEPRILSMIQHAYPDVGKHPFRARTQYTQSIETKALRLLLPRLKPSQVKPRPDRDANLTLGVITSPQAGGEAATLEAVASNQNGWTVVDRMDVDTALRESQIADPWAGGEFRFAELGDRMAADLLVLVSRIDSEQMKLLRFEVIDVTSGLAVLREHLDAKEFDPEKTVAPLLQRTRAAILSAREGDRPTAITLLPFSIDASLQNGQSMLGVFHAAVQAEIDAAPGLLTVGMNEVNAVGGEQALAGEGTFWAAAYTLEGGVTAHEGDQVSVTLRMRSMQDHPANPIDSTVHGRNTEIPALATRAWQALAKSDGVHFKATASEPDAAQRTAEAARLLREAQWLNASKLYAEAATLLDRANALGATPQTLVSEHYRALVKQIQFFRFLSRNDDILVTPHPITLRHQAELFASLDAAQNLLDQIAYYLSRFGPEFTSWREQRFHQAVVALSYLRACIPNVLPEGASSEAVSHFCQSLDRFTADYFKFFLKAKATKLEIRNPDIFNNILYNEEISATMLRRNPELLAGRISLFFKLSKAAPSSPYNRSLFENLMGNGDPLTYGKKRLLLDAISQRMDEVSAHQRPTREAEWAYLSSYGETQPPAARALIEVLSAQNRSQWQRTQAWIKPQIVFRRFGLNLYGVNDCNPWVIPAIIHEPRGHNDWISQAGYNWTILDHVLMEAMQPKDAKRKLEHIHPRSEWSTLAEAASKTAKPREAIDAVYRRAGDWELTYGRTLRDALEKQAERLYLPKAQDSPDTLQPKLLVDFRQLDPNMPGMLYLPTVDRKHNQRLWLYYQPYEPEPEKDGSVFQVTRRHPKIVAIDCGTGEIKVTADVAKAPGIRASQSGRYSAGIHYHKNNFLSQTDDLILTSIPWPRGNSQRRIWPEVGILIRKDTGTFLPLTPQVSIKELACLASDSSTAFGAIAIGDQFISAIQSERSGSGSITHELIQIEPDGTVTELTQYGRRPEVTPFDPIDRFARMLVPDGNRVLVIHHWNHGAHFNPKQNTWEPCEETPNQLYKHVKRKVTQDFQHHIFSCHRIPKNGTIPEITIQWDQNLPDMLALSKRRGELHRLPVHLELPPGLADEIVYSNQAREGEGYNRNGPFTTYNHHKETNMFNIVVVHKTPTHLILAKQVGEGFNWATGKRTGEYLPALWSLPIKDLQEALMAQD